MLKLADQSTRLAYTPEEAAESVGVTARTIHNEINRGRLEAVEIDGRRRIPADELLRYLNHTRRRPAAGR